MSTLTRKQEMLGAGRAMLAKVNQTPKTVLTLLTNRGG